MGAASNRAISFEDRRAVRLGQIAPLLGRVDAARDATAARALKVFVHKLRRAGTKVFVAGARRTVRRTLLIGGLVKPDVLYVRSVADAREKSVAPSSAPNPDRAGPGIASIGSLGMGAASGAVEEGKA